MKVLVAPDSFKGSMTSVEASKAIKKGIEKADSNAVVRILPMADGGEGTLDAIEVALSCKRIDCQTTDPLGRPIRGSFLWDEEKKLAVIETAVASGITLVTEQERNPSRTTTHGTGMIMKAALDREVSEIVIGIGGSATVDGGAGFLQELGVKFYDAKDEVIDRVTGELSMIYRIDTDNLDSRLKKVAITVASDVRNPLLGVEGAISIFGPQKGVQEKQIVHFESGMRQFAELTAEVTGHDHSLSKGAGASGGFGFTLLSYLKGQMRSGFELIAQITKLEKNIEWADLVISGEGKLDRQTFFGKGPMGIVNYAQKNGKPVILFAGAITEEFSDELYKYENLIAGSILQSFISIEEAMDTGERLLEAEAYRMVKALSIGRELKFK